MKRVATDDVRGSEIAASTLAHLARSTRPKYVLNASDLTDHVEVSTAEGCPRRDGGVMRASTAPGPGQTPKMEALGAPVAVVE